MEKVSNIIPYFIKELSGIAHEREIISWAYICIEFYLGYSKSDCILNSDADITTDFSETIKQIIPKLRIHTPLQYILGETEFYGLKFKVNKYTLIPRHETEELVDWILQEKFCSALDIGTGSGCISIALAKNSSSSITALDISKNALKTASLNADLNGVNIRFLNIDILKVSDLPKTDLIVSNPPYVLDSERSIMNDNVLKFEPHQAIFISNNNPLIFYQRIAELAFSSLSVNGKLFFEINECLGSEIINMLSYIGFVDIELKKDINDKDRMIKAIKK